jgi:hypothetical protein
MLVDQRLGRITEKKLGYDHQTNIFLTIQSFLKNVTAIAVGSKVNDTTPASLM